MTAPDFDLDFRPAYRDPANPNPVLIAQIISEWLAEFREERGLDEEDSATAGRDS